MRAFRFFLVAAQGTLALTGCELIAAVDHDLIGSGGSGAGPSARSNKGLENDMKTAAISGAVIAALFSHVGGASLG